MALISLFIFLFLAFRHTVLGQVLQNNTIDDSDPVMRYFGDWWKSAPSELDEGGGHMLTSDPNAQAVFEFTGVAVYFLSPLWPYDVTTQIQLDSRPPQLLNLRDFNSQQLEGGFETIASHIVWGCEGLENGPHMLSVSVGPNVWAIVDGFIVTSFNQSVTTTQTSSELEPNPTVTVHETTTATASPNPASPSARSGGVNMLSIGLGAGIAFLVLIVAAALIFCSFRRRRSPRGQLKIDLEKDFPSFPKPARDFSTPPLLSTSNPSSPTAPQSPPTIHFPHDRQHRVLAFAPRQPRNAVGGATAMDSRRSTLDEPPPGYYEAMSAYRRSRWGTARITLSAPRNLDPPPPVLFPSVYAPPIQNKH